MSNKIFTDGVSPPFYFPIAKLQFPFYGDCPPQIEENNLPLIKVIELHIIRTYDLLRR